MPTHANALAVMAKAPIAGTVKTRLVPPLTDVQAAEISRALLSDLLAQLRKLSEAERYLYYTPEHAGSLMAAIAGPEFHLKTQRGGDLGARMDAVFADLWLRGHRSVILIGGDLPAFPLDFVNQAYAFLAARSPRVVLGPSRDGGYYLVGMNHPVPEIFDDMTWSHDQVLARTLAKLKALQVPSMLLPLWYDIDTATDLDLLRHLDPGAAARIRSTLQWLQRWDDR